MIRSTLTKDRLFDLTLDRASEYQDARPDGYRFGRISRGLARGAVRRVLGGAKALFGTMMRIVTAAKLRRIEREFRIRRLHQDWQRIDDDHFTPVDR